MDERWGDPLTYAVNTVVTDRATPRPVLYRYGSDGLTVTDHPGQPWQERTVDGRADPRALTPGLIRLGHHDNSIVAIDLEAARFVSVGGQPHNIHEWLTDLTALETCRVVTVGPLNAASRDNLVFASVADALAFVELRVGHVCQQLDTYRYASLLDSRLDAALTALTDPLVLLVLAAQATSQELRALSVLTAQEGGAVAVVVDGAGFSPWRLTLTDATVSIDGLDETIVAPPPTRNLDRSSTSSTTASTQHAVVVPTSLALGRFRGGRPTLTLRVLGLVDIEGPTATSIPPRSLEMAVYLSLHPDGVTDSQLIDALWGEHSPSRASINNAASALRRILGVDDHGRPLFPRARNGRYRVADSVVCDLTQLTRAARDHLDDLDALESALRYVRGRPFTARAGYDWATLEGFTARAELDIITAALHVERLALAKGDLGRAIGAIDLAFNAVPHDPRLQRHRTRLHDEFRNTVGLA